MSTPVTASRLEGDFTFAGAIRFLKVVTLLAGSITDADISVAANIAATKVNHQHRIPYGQPNTAATSETRILFVARGAGTIIDLVVGSIVKAVGAATVTVDIQKSSGGGAFASILSSVVTLNSSNVDRVPVHATLGIAGVLSYVADDIFEVIITATAGGGTLPTGVFLALTANEAPA